MNQSANAGDNAIAQMTKQGKPTEEIVLKNGLFGGNTGERANQVEIGENFGISQISLSGAPFPLLKVSIEWKLEHGSGNAI